MTTGKVILISIIVIIILYGIYWLITKNNKSTVTNSVTGTPTVTNPIRRDSYSSDELVSLAMSLHPNATQAQINSFRQGVLSNTKSSLFIYNLLKNDARNSANNIRKSCAWYDPRTWDNCDGSSNPAN